MPIVKIIKKYESKENYSPGDVVDISNPWTLIEVGIAVLVDDNGREIERPETLKQLRRLVRTTGGIKMVGNLISSHPEKEKIMQELRDEGVMLGPPKLDEVELPAISFNETVLRPIKIQNKTKEELRKEVEDTNKEV